MTWLSALHVSYSFVMDMRILQLAVLSSWPLLDLSLEYTQKGKKKDEKPKQPSKQLATSVGRRQDIFTVTMYFLQGLYDSI